MALLLKRRRQAQNRQIWDARTLERRSTWRLHVPREAGDEFVALCLGRPDLAQDLDAFEFDPVLLPKLAAFGNVLRHNLLEGDGLAWIQGVGQLALTTMEKRLFYVALGAAMGTAMTQHGRLFPVGDRCETGAETGFHTDTSARGDVPDFVGLLCEEPSQNGGDSLVSNALSAHELLRRDARDVLAVLYGEFVRDLTPEARSTHDNLLTNRFPVFARCDRREGLVFRYMRYWIERGSERAGLPLSDRQHQALEILDETLSSPELAVSFRLETGDILWVNNRTLAHNRTDYVDTPGNVRRLQRMWVKAAVV